MFTLQTHKFATDPKTNLSFCVKKSNYLRLSKAKPYPSHRNTTRYQSLGTYYLQGGSVWTEGGKQIPVHQVPEWVRSELKKTNLAYLREIGFGPEHPLLHDISEEGKRGRGRPKKVEDSGNSIPG